MSDNIQINSAILYNELDKVVPYVNMFGTCVTFFSLYYTFTPLSPNLFNHYLITLLQGHMAKHAVTLWLTFTFIYDSLNYY